MSRRSRIFAAVFVLYVGAVAFLLYRVVSDLDPRYRESAEESLVDTANLLATLLERNTFNGVIPTDDLERTLAQLKSRPVYARIFGIEKTAVDLRVYVTDRNGIVLFDSAGRDVGVDYLAWRDVQRTLEGGYGARTTLTDEGDPQSAVMYVGAAIRERGNGANILAGDDIVGMVAVGKPVHAFNPFITNARAKLLQVGAISVAAFALLLIFVAVWLVRPFGLLSDVWRAARREGSASSLARRSLQAFKTALAEVRDTFSGRSSYADEYVQTLAHELKSPLAAIRGAAELLREPMPEQARARFTNNIEEQVARSQDLLDRLLELSSVERRGVLSETQPLSVERLVTQVCDELLPSAARKNVALNTQLAPALWVNGDSFLLQRALSNLLRNAIDFTPAGSRIEITAQPIGRQIRLSVRDQGPGLPAFAAARAFDKFFSLPRPDSGTRGTGLGLSLVREVAALHGGSVKLLNHPQGGAEAVLSLPRLRLSDSVSSTSTNTSADANNQ